MRGGRQSVKGTSGVVVKRREHQLMSLIPMKEAKILVLPFQVMPISVPWDCPIIGLCIDAFP